MQEKARKIVMNYFNNHVNVTDNKKITMDDVFVVWWCKTLQNWKALVSTNVSDGMYYEVTHNGDKDETYVDVYKKWENFTVKKLGVDKMEKDNGMTIGQAIEAMKQGKRCARKTWNGKGQYIELAKKCKLYQPKR